MSLDNNVAKVMVSMANLSKVEASLRFLADMNVIKQESIYKGCKKFVAEHPEIQNWIDSKGFLKVLEETTRNK